MQTHSKTLLCRYQYDPLDRLVDCELSGQESARRFYQKNRLATEINGTVKRSIMQHEDQLLAQQQRQSESVETSLLATDQQRSVLTVLDESEPRPITHTPYGHRPLASGLLSLLGFNGERPDPVTGHYLLGNGYRAFNPVLMRFNSPDSWSPFGKGGLNVYAYCGGDPINRVDPTGHLFSIPKLPQKYNPINRLRKIFGGKKKSPATTSTDITTESRVPDPVSSRQASRVLDSAPPPYSDAERSIYPAAPGTQANPNLSLDPPPSYFKKQIQLDSRVRSQREFELAEILDQIEEERSRERHWAVDELTAAANYIRNQLKPPLIPR